jgi:hypothetical protein
MHVFNEHHRLSENIQFIRAFIETSFAEFIVQQLEFSRYARSADWAKRSAVPSSLPSNSILVEGKDMVEIS